MKSAVPKNFTRLSKHELPERTCAGEQEQARRWEGAAIFCGKCGDLLQGLLFMPHRCITKLGTDHGKKETPKRRKSSLSKRPKQRRLGRA